MVDTTQEQREFFMSLYAPGGAMEGFNVMKEAERLQWGTHLFKLITTLNLIDFKNLDAFRFVSVSAHQAHKEWALARRIDLEMQMRKETGEMVKGTPTVVAADKFVNFIKAQGETQVIPGFSKDFPPKTTSGVTEKLKKVRFYRVTADATDEALKRHSFKVVFDRAGAVWHEADALFVGSHDPTRLKRLFATLEELLSPEGVIILDAGAAFPHTVGVDNPQNSTLGKLESFLGKPRSGLERMFNLTTSLHTVSTHDITRYYLVGKSA